MHEHRVINLLNRLLIKMKLILFNYGFQCLAKPLKPQYNGGIVMNPEFEDALNGWKKFGNGTIEHKTSPDGNNYAVASQRVLPFDSLSQTFHLKKDNLYAFSGTKK